MCSKHAIIDGKTDTIECFGPIALRIAAVAAVLAVFAPLLLAFAAPFIG